MAAHCNTPNAKEKRGLDGKRKKKQLAALNTMARNSVDDMAQAKSVNLGSHIFASSLSNNLTATKMHELHTRDAWGAAFQEKTASDCSTKRRSAAYI